MFTPEELQQAKAQFDAYQVGAKSQQRATKTAPKPKKKNFFLDQISTIGGIAGGIAGLPLGLIGAGGGAALGSGLGEGIENAITGDSLTKNVGKEAALGGVLGAGPIRLAKAGIGLASRGAAGAAERVAPNVTGKVAQGVTDRAATNLLKLTPAQTQRMLDAGVDPATLAKRATQFGKSAEEIIGRTGSGGPLQQTIRGLEDGITQTTKTAGSNLRIPGDELIKGLKTEAKAIKREIGGGARLKAMNQLIADAEKKYAKGITVAQARSTLKEANQRFGASVLDDTGDAVARAAQKLEANTLRSALKTRYPGIAKALDDQSELIQLREVLKGTRAKNITGGFKTGRLDFTRPGTFVDPLLNSKGVSNRVLGGAPEASLPTARGIATKVGAGGLLLGGDNGQQQDPSLEAALTQSMNSSTSPTSMADPNSMSNTDMSGLSQETSPYSREALMADIQRDPANASKYMDYYSQLQDVYAAPESSQKPMSAEASKITSNAQIGLQALDDFENAINQDPSVLAKRVIPGRGLLGGALGGALGTRGADAAASQIIDVIARLRTGAAITNDEAKRFETFIPQAADPEDVRQQKLNYLRGQFQMVAQRGSGPSTLEEALMQSQQGGY